MTGHKALERLMDSGVRLDTPETRMGLASELAEAGLCERGAAEQMVEILARERRGEALPPALQKILDRRRRHIIEAAALSGEFDQQMEAVYAANRANAQMKALRGELEDERNVLVVLKESLEQHNLGECYMRRRRGSCSGMQGVDRHVGLGQWIAGAREAAKLLEREIIPRLERELAKAIEDGRLVSQELNAEPKDSAAT